MFKENHTKNISFNKEICFVILGHEIDQETFELSDSGKGRCELLSKLISNQENDNFFVIFMGLGRRQKLGKCTLSISECMYKYFKENYFSLPNYYIDKKSLDSVGDAVYSFTFFRDINYKGKIFLITSDWHLRRVKIIFKKIFGNLHSLYFFGSKELGLANYSEIKKIKNNENLSIEIFEKTFDSFDIDKDDPLSFLLKKHPLYFSS